MSFHVAAAPPSVLTAIPVKVHRGEKSQTVGAMYVGRQLQNNCRF